MIEQKKMQLSAVKQRSQEDLLERDEDGTSEMLRETIRVKDEEIERLQNELTVSQNQPMHANELESQLAAMSNKHTLEE